MRLRDAWPYGLFAAVTLAAGGEALFLGRTFHDVRTARAHLGDPAPPPHPVHAHRPPADRGDTVFLLPMHFEIYNEGLKRGELRLWNPRLFGGYPLYYDTMLHPFYPPHLVLHLLFPPGPAYTLTLFLHLFFAGASMFLLCRGFGRSEAASAAAGLVWMLWGYSAVWWSTGILEGVSVFGPLALLALHRSRPALAGLALGLAVLGSHPQHALLLGILLAAWAAARRTRGALVFGAVTLGVGMPAILTRLDSIANGHRQAGGDFGMLYDDRWSVVLSHLVGLPFGKAWFSADGLVRGEFAVFLGIAGTALALAGACRGIREPRIRFLAVFAALALLFAFVRPVAWLLLQVPLLNQSMPSRWVFPAGFCLAVLAADGWDEIARRPGRVPHAIGAGLGLLVLVWLVRPVPLSGAAVAETVLGGLLAVGACLAACRKPRAALALGLSALLLDLLPPFLHQNQPAGELPTVATAPPEPEPGRALGGLRFPDAAPGDPRTWNLAVGNNLLALHGIESFAGYEAILPSSYVDYGLAAGGDVAGSGRVAAFERFDSRLLDAANVTRLYWPFPGEPGGRWRLEGTRGPLRIYGNPEALPRARLATKAWAAYPPEDAPLLLRSGRVDLKVTVILEGELELPPLDARNAGVIWLERSTDRLALRVTSDGHALLVLADAWDEGWEATIDGKETPVHRANVMFRAVVVPAGERVVEFRFRPASARNGLLVAVLTAAALLGLAAKRRFASAGRRGILPSDRAL